MDALDRCAAALAVLAALWYAASWDHGELVPVASIEGFDPTHAHDEYRNMLVARSIREGAVPRLLEKVYVLHPPGFYAAVAAAASLVGDLVWASHLVVSLSAGAAVALLYLVVRRLAGGPAALASALVLALHPSFAQYARLILDPAPLCLLYAATHLLYLRALGGDRQALRRGAALAAAGMLTKLNYAPCLLSLALASAWRRSRGRASRHEARALALFLLGAALGEAVWMAYLWANGLPDPLTIHRDVAKGEAETWGVGGVYDPFWSLPAFAGWPVLALAALALALPRPPEEDEDAVPLLVAWVAAPLAVFGALSPALFRWKFVVFILLPLVSLAALGLRRALRGGPFAAAAAVLAAWCVAAAPADPLASEREAVWRQNQAVLAELRSLDEPEGVILSPTFFREIALFTDDFSEHVDPADNATLLWVLGYGGRWVFSHGPVPALEGKPFAERVMMRSCPSCRLLRVDADALTSYAWWNASSVALRVLDEEGRGVRGARVLVLPVGAEGRRLDFRTTDQGVALLRLPPRMFEVRVFPFGYDSTTAFVSLGEGGVRQCSPRGSEGGERVFECVQVDEVVIRAQPRWRWHHRCTFSRF